MEPEESIVLKNEDVEGLMDGEESEFEFYGLTRKQMDFLAVLLEGTTIRDACNQSDVCHATAYRWMLLPEFKRAFRFAKRQVVASAKARLQAAASGAAKVLISIAQDENLAAATRIKAATSILTLVMRDDAEECDQEDAFFADLSRRQSETVRVQQHYRKHPKNGTGVGQ